MKRQISYVAALVLVAAMAAAESQVQAFLPNLNPARRVAAVYPETARQQNVSGFVEVLVTFDPTGKVTDAEVLEGQDVLRQAALDAVKQWTFRPVLRDGHAVFAMTDVSVEVTARGERPRLDFNPRDSMAAAKRISQLKKQFPRSPEQVLADDEQQSAPESGLQRFYALPKLSKDAIRAGATDRAGAYANELLELAPQYPKDWNYGNAIHDGNMVLGLVALRNGRVAHAERYLREAGKTPGSPQLTSFGPNMILAKELLDAGQSAAVLEYLEECRTFWKMGGRNLDDWSATVRGGGKPDFGANLLY